MYCGNMHATDLAYYAGLLDGEGHLGIRRTDRGDGIVRYYSRLSLRMSEPGIISRFATDFGLTARRANCGRSELTHVAMYGVETAGRGAADVLEQAAPYMHVKRRQAELLIQLEAEKQQPGLRTKKIPTVREVRGALVHSTSSATGSGDPDRWQTMYEECRALNRSHCAGGSESDI